MSSAARLRVSQIDENPNRLRISYDPSVLTRLTGSIQAMGLLSPIHVVKKPRGWKFWKARRYMLVDGHARFVAVKSLGMTEIPAIICKMHGASILEHNLNSRPRTIKEIAEATGHSEEWVRQAMIRGRSN